MDPNSLAEDMSVLKSSAAASGTDDKIWPNRGPAVVASEIVFILISTTFVIWRLVVVYLAKRRYMLADYLIFLAACFNFVANVFSIVTTFYGQGRHLNDPSLTPEGLIKCFKYTFVGQMTNLFSMFLLKASISSYLITLNFSPRYRLIIWISIGIIIVCNFLMPNITILGRCRPVSLNWNTNQPGSCWPTVVNVISGYTQSSANIITDIIYASSPLVYLAHVQLPRRTQWGLRVVFLLGLLGTGVSIAKLFTLKSLLASDDITFAEVDLSILSSAEVSTGIFAACLPPLRKTFDRLFHRILPTTLLSSSGNTRTKPTNKYQLRSYRISKHQSHKSLTHVNDYGSERTILPDRSGGSPDSKEGGIVKTTRFAIEDEESRPISGTYRDNWHSPMGTPLASPRSGPQSGDWTPQGSAQWSQSSGPQAMRHTKLSSVDAIQTI